MLKGGKLRDSLARTRGSIFGQIAGLFGASDIDDELWDDLEALLIQADLGVDTTLSLVEAVKDRVAREGITKAPDVERIPKEEMLTLLNPNGAMPSGAWAHAVPDRMNRCFKRRRCYPDNPK